VRLWLSCAEIAALKQENRRSRVLFERVLFEKFSRSPGLLYKKEA
jgi:hypothetical protein